MREQAKVKCAEIMKKADIAERFENTVGFKHVISGRRYFVTFEVETLEQAAKVLKNHAPTNKTNKLGFAGKDDEIINTPYHVSFDSPARVTPYTRPQLKIVYACGEIDIWLTMPSELVKELRGTGNRSVTDSEYHYFTGISMRKIREISIPTYYLLGGESQSYYGGQKTARNVEAIDKLIAFIKEH